MSYGRLDPHIQMHRTPIEDLLWFRYGVFTLLIDGAPVLRTHIVFDPCTDMDFVFPEHLRKFDLSPAWRHRFEEAVVDFMEEVEGKR